MPTGVYKRSKEQIANMKKAQKGLKKPPFTLEHRKKISESRKGMRYSEETKRKMGKAHLIGEKRQTPYEANRRYYLKNPERIKKMWRDKEKRRRWSNVFCRISSNLSRAIYESLKEDKGGRHWEIIVGYKLDDLKARLESQFDSKTSWDNYGSYWHLDHIKPKVLFGKNEIKECWALSNLQPLEKGENMRKGCRYEPETISNIKK